MKKLLEALGATFLFILLPALGAGIGLVVTLYQFEFDSTSAGFLTFFLYLFQIILLILAAIPNMIIGIAVGIVLAIIATLMIHFFQKRGIKKAPENQGSAESNNF